MQVGGNLFTGRRLREEAANRTQDSLRAVAAADVNYLLERDLDLLLDEMVDAFSRVTIQWDDAHMITDLTSSTTTETDLLGHRVNRTQASFTLRVPVVGDALLLTYRSDSGAPAFGGPEGTVRKGALDLTWTGDLNASEQDIQRWRDRRRTEVESFLTHNNNDVAHLNDSMRRNVQVAIERRRHDELGRRNLAARLPFPVKRRPEAVQPVAIERKRLRFEQSSAAQGFAPEPAIEDAVYEDILRDCVLFAAVFERTPSIETMREPSIRNLFLGMLNTNYMDRSAGEVFNGAGKTDICVRANDRHVFISECKIYDGPKTVTDAVDQLLGYLVWRDTKAALILFVRRGKFTDVVQRAVDAVSAHPQCQRVYPADDPNSRSDYLFARKDDPSRTIRLALLPFRLRGDGGLSPTPVN